MKSIILLLLTSSIIYSQIYLKVIADFANVRQRPDVNSRIVAKLPTGYSVTVTDSSSEWYKCSHGWVHSTTVSDDKKLKNYLARENLAKCSTLQDSICWLERSRSYWLYSGYYYGANDTTVVSRLNNLLSNCYLRAGDSLRAEYVMKPGQIHLADNYYGMRYIGSLDESGDFTPRTWDILYEKQYWDDYESDRFRSWTKELGYPHPDWVKKNCPSEIKELHREIEQWRTSLMGLTWYSLTDEGAIGTCVAPVFATPDDLTGLEQVCPCWGTCFGAIFLDTTHTNSPLFATKPFIVPVKTRGLQTKEDIDRVWKCIEILRGPNFADGGIGKVNALFLPDGSLDITIEAKPAYSSDYFSSDDILRGIFSSKDSLLWPKVSGKFYGYRAFNYYYLEGNFVKSSRHHDWFTVKGLDQYYYILIPYAQAHKDEKGNMVSGRLLIRHGPGGIKCWEVGIISNG